MYLGQLIWPMFAAGWVLSLIERGKAAWERLDPVLRAPLSIDDHGTHRAMRRRGALALRARDVRLSPGRRRSRGDRAADRASPTSRSRCRPVPRSASSDPPAPASRRCSHLLLRHYAPQQGAIIWGARGARRLHARRAARRARLGAAGGLPVLRQRSPTTSRSRRPERPRAEIEQAARMADLARRHPALSAAATTTLVGERGDHAVRRPAPAGGDRARTPRPTRRCCCSTTRCPPSTRAPRRASSRTCATPGAAAPRSSSAIGCRRWPMPTRSSCCSSGRIVERGTHAELARAATAGTRRSGATSSSRPAWRPRMTDRSPRPRRPRDDLRHATGAHERAATALRAAVARRAARPREVVVGATLWLAVAGLLEAAGPDLRQAVHRRVPAAARRSTGRRWRCSSAATSPPAGAATIIRYFQLVRLAGLATRSVRRLRESVYGHVLRAADGVLRPRDHRPAREPHHQRHRGGEAALHAGAVRGAGRAHRAVRRHRRDALARLAADADRAAAGAGDDRRSCWGYQRLSAGAGHALARAAQRHQRADGRGHRRHERAAGRRARRSASRDRFADTNDAHYAARHGRGARQRVAAAAGARLRQHPADRRSSSRRSAREQLARRRGRPAVRVHRLRRARRRAADPDHDAVLARCSSR